MAVFWREKSIEPVVSNSPTENDSSLDYHGRPFPTPPRLEGVYRPIYSKLCSGGLLHLDLDKRRVNKKSFFSVFAKTTISCGVIEANVHSGVIPAAF